MKLPLAFTFVLGLTAGCAVTILLLPEIGPVPAALEGPRAPAPAEAESELLRLRLDLREKDADLASARSQIIRLENELAASRAAEAEETAALESEEAARQARREEREAAFARRMQERTDRELQQLLRVADLSPTQAAAIQQLLTDRSARRLAAMDAHRNGTEMPTYDGPSFRESLAAVLSPEQLAAYDSYEETVRSARIETGATAMMNRIAPELLLSEEQKDRVYALFYNDLVTRMESEEADSDGDGAARQSLLSAQMRQVLTPEQFADWEALSARQNDWRGRGGPPRFGP